VARPTPPKEVMNILHEQRNSAAAMVAPAAAAPTALVYKVECLHTSLFAVGIGGT